MISGVRASSISMLSASSTRMKCGARWTGLSPPTSRLWPSMPPRKSTCPSPMRRSQQLVAEKVEAEFLGRAVSHVAAIGLAALALLHFAFDHADRHAQAVEDRPHDWASRAAR